MVCVERGGDEKMEIQILGWIFVAVGALAACGFAWMKIRVKVLIQSGPAAAMRDIAWICFPMGLLVLVASKFGWLE